MKKLIPVLLFVLCLNVQVFAAPDACSPDVLERAKSGDAGAQFKIAVAKRRGACGESDGTTAVFWFRKAAEQGFPESEFVLGYLYAVGEGVEKDPRMAVQWYEKAVKHGELEADVHLGRMYLNGEGVAKDDKKAFELFQVAGEGGNLRGQFMLGEVYREGRGVKKDLATAFAWYMKAAEQGHSIAGKNVGTAYAKGLGVARDDAKAVFWYRKATDHGNVQAARNLGLMYELGRGVAPNDGMAAKLYAKAADKGYDKAQYNLARLYETGRGVERDPAKARALYEAAAKQGYEPARKALAEKSEKFAPAPGVGHETEKAAVESGLGIDVAGPFYWDGSSDFAGGYFDVFYDKGLMVAIPSIYTNNLVGLMVAHPEDVNNCVRRRPEALRNFITAKFREVEKDPTNAPLYRKGALVGRIGDVVVDGVGGWRLPTYKEMAPKNSFVAVGWQMGLCWDSYIGQKFPRSDSSQYRGSDIITYTKGGTRRNGTWKVVASVMGVYTRNKKLWKQLSGAESDALVLVREPTDIEKTVFSASGLSPEARVIRYADMLASEALTPKRREVRKPEVEAYPAEPELTKSEFEKTVTFEKRKAEAMAKWAKEKESVDARNRERLDNYDVQVGLADEEFRRQKALFATEDHRKEVYRQSMYKAIRQVLGKPYFKEMHYDADAEQMHGVVFSARYPEFRKPFSARTPIGVAKKVKDGLLAGTYVPQVRLDKHCTIEDTVIVSNEQKIKFEWEVAQKLNSKDAYRQFRSKYPSSSYDEQALRNIEKLKAEEDRERQEYEARIKAKQREKEEQRARNRKAFLAAKKPGDKVCLKASVLGMVHYTISAHVERVEGNRMQLRILSTESQKPYYLDRTLYPGDLIWDYQQQWMLCN